MLSRKSLSGFALIQPCVRQSAESVQSPCYSISLCYLQHRLPGLLLVLKDFRQPGGNDDAVELFCWMTSSMI